MSKQHRFRGAGEYRATEIGYSACEYRDTDSGIILITEKLRIGYRSCHTEVKFVVADCGGL
jgi:hypothetical protein